MESVLCDLWAGLQDANQEVCKGRRCSGLWTARDSDQTLQHSSVSWLVASPFTSHTQSSPTHSLPQRLLMHDLFLVFLPNHKDQNDESSLVLSRQSFTRADGDQFTVPPAKVGTDAASVLHHADCNNSLLSGGGNSLCQPTQF